MPEERGTLTHYHHMMALAHCTLMSMVALDTRAVAVPRAGMRWEGGGGRGDRWGEGRRRSWEDEKRCRAESQCWNRATVTLSDSCLYSGSASSW